ncbi:nucleotide 5'-monophosphate nucleosidase PpnN [Thiomicrospira microaerophila]|uniref:nucleotide 5'-monophosphate nucleosidase PpnN n=1 Tax=Thiomicrospira microaerophila TaxID=406020 RepID=UPI0005C9E244|nr:nucleotide 5'-monophosphate nucleosidase PpnN [Thiomicrospira microaerophila]
MSTKNNEMTIRPNGALQILSKQEANQLCDHSDTGLNDLLRRCSLAVLNTGNNIDCGEKLLEMHPDFDIKVQSRGRGIELIICNPPESAFIDGEMLEGLREHLFAVVRDLVYVRNNITDSGLFDLNDSAGITNAVFHILRNAEVLRTNEEPNLVACWGGHAISRREYEYSRHVGIALGERRLNICTGCGPGVMKGPMRGAEAGHHNQRFTNRRYIGLSEPGIIAAEAPNTVVNELVILPDIEKRLEAFVRLAHGIIIFPGGPGTLEELLYILSILLDPKNTQHPYPLVLTGDKGCANYFEEVKYFISQTLGQTALDRLNIQLDNPDDVASFMKQQMQVIKKDRIQTSDAYYFNWQIHIEADLQKTFEPTHQSMRALNLTKAQPAHLLASQLRCAFSGIVAGNVKAEGLRAVAQHGPFELCGDPEIMAALERLLNFMIEQKRMKIDAENYIPSYRILKTTQ